MLIKRRILISDLLSEIKSYLSEEQVSKVYKAYLFAAEAHDGQIRRSGEAYIFHPLEVAMILAKLKLDHYCIIAAILHDCIEDTIISKQEVDKEFGSQIGLIVEGVSKLKNLRFNSQVEKQAENFRKLFLAMNKDIRVILIKLADRLHNIRTLSFMPREKQVKIAKETLGIHAPVARRLGLNSVREELEELSFAILHPKRYKVFKNTLKKNAGNHSKLIKQTKNNIEKRIKEENFEAIVVGRMKKTYSLFQKMKQQKLKFNEILDICGFRIIVKNVADCYLVLGTLHNLYKPMPGKFKDYIALPKSNGYQSLHTILLGPQHMKIEVQIRTHKMDNVAEHGIAAHAQYKHSSKNENIASQWLNSLLELQKNTDTSVEFLKEVKVDLFPDEVLVFTPKGKIIQLPFKATALDFAYAVHTEIGNHCFKIRVDQKSVSFDFKLRNGQTIEVITKEYVEPHPNWLQLATTSKARTAIKAELKNKSQDELISLGKRMLEIALRSEKIELEKINRFKWRNYLNQLNYNNKEEVFKKIALGELLLPIIVKVFLNKIIFGKQKGITIKGKKEMVTNFAHCCYPIPGDKVVGVISKNKGLVVHRSSCNNILSIKSRKSLIDLGWGDNIKNKYHAFISIEVKNHRSILAEVASKISQMDIAIENLTVREKDRTIKYIDIVIMVTGRKELHEVFRELESLEFFKSVQRK